MHPTLESLGIDKLSRDEKIALIDEIWDSLECTPLPPLSEAKRRELERRIAEDDADPDGGIPWETVLANTRARLRHRRENNLPSVPAAH